VPIYCEICKKELLLITSKHLKKHQLTVAEYKNLYPNAILSSNERNAKLSLVFMGHKSWNKGFTKETNDSMLISSKKHKGQLPWNTGLTKESDMRVLEMSKAVQKGVQQYFDNGGKSWLNGLTSETDLRVKKLTDNKIGKLVTVEQKQKISIGVTNAWKRGNFLHVRPMGGGCETIYHKNKKENIAMRLNKLGFKVTLERFVHLDGKTYAIDIFAKNSKETLVIEVGTCDKQKENILINYCDRYFRVPYYDEIKNKFII